ncbi:MAG: type II secretion system F family protein [Candidatus Sericytochromatia bacterium]|nr:type II secretion system F family protein [Candidatus Sericytochromatia bacterium]
MDPLLLLLFGLMFASLFLGLLAIAKPKQREDVESRLRRLSSDDERPGFRAVQPDAPPPRTASIAEANAQLDELFRPWAAGRLSEGQATELTQLLHAAGRYGTPPLQLRVWQLKCAVLLPFCGVVFTFALLGFNAAVVALVTLAGTVGGYFYPVFALQREASQRRDLILKQLPTTLDLLTVCVEAGLSLQAGIQKVVEKTRPNPLREELAQVLREIQLGRPRGDALKEMARRVGLKEVNSVVLAMVQAEAMGTGIAKSLRIQSEIARDTRIQRAQEQAMQAPVKLSFPLVFFIFPVVFIVIFGPVALELFTNWVGQ